MYDRDMTLIELVEMMIWNVFPMMPCLGVCIF